MICEQYYRRAIPIYFYRIAFSLKVFLFIVLLVGFMPAAVSDAFTEVKIKKKLILKYEQNADALLLMIKQHQFEKVDSFFGYVVKNDHITRDGQRYLTAILGHWFYSLERVAPFPEDLLAVLNTWIDRYPSSAIAHIIRGAFYISHAWEARGGGWSKDVKPEAWSIFNKRLNKAQTDLDRAHELDPQSPHAPRQMMRFNKQIGGSAEKQELLFQQVISRAPTFYYAYRSELEALMPKWGGTWEAMFAFARQTEKQAPPNTLLPLILAKAHLEAAVRSGNKKEYYRDTAVWNDISRVYKRIIADFPDSERWKTEFGDFANAAGKKKLAKRYRKLASTNDPYYFKTLQGLSALYKKEKNWELSEKYARKLVQLYPQYVQGHSSLGWALYKQKRFQEAIESYNLAIQLDFEKAHYWALRGYCYHKIQNYTQAINDCTKAIKLDPNYRWAYKYRAYAHDKMGNIEAGDDDYYIYEELKPNKKPRSDRAIEKLNKFSFKNAWRLVSDELKDPEVTSQEDLCELHLVTLQVLQNIVAYDFAPDDPDSVAKTSYDYVQTNCQDFKNKLRATENQYANYFSNTWRYGLAIPYYKRALKLADDDPYERMCDEFGIAGGYDSMGVTELRDYYMDKAIKSGKEWKKFLESNNASVSLTQLGTYKNLLEYRHNLLARYRDAETHFPEMHRLWDEIEIANRSWSHETGWYIAYHSALERFAYAGDIAFAKKLLKEADELWEKYPHDNHVETYKLERKLVEAQLLKAKGDFKAAADLIQDWVAQFQKTNERILEGSDYRIAGLIQESAGNYNLAIQYLQKSISKYEELRSSFEVKQRGRVLTDFNITPYWGLTRSHAAKFLQNRNEIEFKNAIQAARKLRARQFGELLGISSRIENEFNIKALQLDPQELLLNIVMTDKAIVLFAVSSEWHDLFLIPYEQAAFDDSVSAIRAQLYTPQDTGTLFAELSNISQTVLAPVQNKLKRYRKLTIIPDGTLNGIPFTLLSSSRNQYHPLILDHEITLTPSISYMIQNRKSRYQKTSDKLLCLANPDYGSRVVPESYRDESRGFYQRAVDNFNLFTPLPETRTEALNIARLFKPRNVTMVYGKEASETKIKSLPLDQYRYLHFATHGVLGNQIPGVDEPALVLAAEPAKTGQDGFLKASEVEELKLNSELAVLSACDTGSGKYYTGEGIMGLSRGFLIAGSQTVVVSLWPVDSETTVDLMTLFYQHLRSGKSKETSLRLAQLALKDSKHFKAYKKRGIKVIEGESSGARGLHPFYWAPFIMIGK